MVQPTEGTQNIRQGHVYNLTCKDAETDLAFIKGTLFFSNILVHALIDLGATHSFVLHASVDSLKLEPRKLGYQMVIATPMGTTQETVIGCQVSIFNMGGLNLKIDLAILDIQDFDVIIGMDFLSIHEAKIDCKNKTMSLLQPSRRWFVF